MYKVLSLLVFFAFVQEVPYKPSAEFEAAVDLQFKSKPTPERPSFDANGNRLERPSGLLPFLAVNVSSIVANNGEFRFKAVSSDNRNIASKKLSPNSSYHFEMGFIEDLKRGTSPNTITIYFLSEKKVEISRIVLTVTKEGDFLVNGEKRGQF